MKNRRLILLICKRKTDDAALFLFISRVSGEENGKTLGILCKDIVTFALSTRAFIFIA